MLTARIRVQSLGRRSGAVHRVQEMLRKRKLTAAVKIQSTVRRLQATQTVEELREANRENERRQREQQTSTVTVARIPRGSAPNERRRGRLTALLRSAYQSPSAQAEEAARRPVPAELVTAPAELLPPLATVARLGSYVEESSPNYSNLPTAHAIDVNDEPATGEQLPDELPAVRNFLNQSTSAGNIRTPTNASTARRRASPNASPSLRRVCPPPPSAPPPPPPAHNSVDSDILSILEATPGRTSSLRRARSIDSTSSPRRYSTRRQGSVAGANDPPRPAASEERISNIAELAAHGPLAESRRGAVALLADEGGRPPGPAVLLALVRPLYDEDATVRVEAVTAAARLGSLELAQFALDDENIHVRRAVLRALSSPNAFLTEGNSCRAAPLIVALMKSLEDVSLDDRSLIAALNRLKAALLQTGVSDGSLLSAPLEKAMQAQRSDAVRSAVVRVAGELRATDALRRVAIFDATPSVRRVGVEMLGWNGAARELRDFVLAAEDDATVRKDALEWLCRLDDATGLAERGLLGDRSSELRARSAQLLGDVVVSRLLLLHEDQVEDSSARWWLNRGGPPLSAPPAAKIPPADILDRSMMIDCEASVLRNSGYTEAVKALGSALQRDSNASVRGAAASQLTRLRCIDELVRGLDDAQPALRHRVVELIGDLDDPDACSQPLANAMANDDDEAVRVAAIDRLGTLGDPFRAIDAVGTADDALAIRELAAKWLGRLERSESLLEKSLVDPQSASVRALAAASLGTIFEKQETKPPQAYRSALLMRLGDKERRVRVAAAKALACMRDKIWADLIKGDEGDCDRLSEIRGPKATAVLVFILCHANQSDDRVAAAEALGRRDRDLDLLSLNALCACCSEASLEPRLRVAALGALEKLLREPCGPDDKALVAARRSRGAVVTPRKSLPPDFYDRLDASLRTSLEDKTSSEVRAAAARATGASVSSGLALSALLDLVRTDNIAEVRATCATELKRFGPENRDAAFALVGALADRDVTTRDRASASFAGFKTAGFSEELAKATVAKLMGGKSSDSRKDFVPVLQATAARALGFLEHASALPALHDALKADKEAIVRRSACVSLGMLRSPKSLKPLLTPFRDKKNPALNEAAKDAISSLDYSQFLQNPSEQILRHAPCAKRSRKIFTTLKSLVLTDHGRLFYVDADTLKQKNCDLATLDVDGASNNNRTLSFQVPGQGRTSVALLYGYAPDWLATKFQALQANAERKTEETRLLLTEQRSSADEKGSYEDDALQSSGGGLMLENGTSTPPTRNNNKRWN